MIVLGITGGLGSGKSTACRFFQQLGARVFDADVEAKKILFTSNIVKDLLVKHFGDAILKNGKIHKESLADIVFNRKSNQQILNKIIHPLVRQKFRHQKSQMKRGIFIMDAALIFESDLLEDFDKTILIYTNKEIRIARAIARGNLSREQILERMNLQMDEEEKRELADIIIENNGRKEDLRNKITELYKKLV